MDRRLFVHTTGSTVIFICVVGGVSPTFFAGGGGRLDDTTKRH